MNKRSRKNKKPKMDFRGNDLLSATWGTLNIAEHLSDFGAVKDRSHRKAIVAAVLGVVAALGAVGIPLLLLHR